MIKIFLLQLEILKILSSTEDRTLKPMLDCQFFLVIKYHQKSEKNPKSNKSEEKNPLFWVNCFFLRIFEKSNF